jgi:signal transduction histidine kinase
MSKPKILVVDDDPIQQKVVKRELEKEGYEIRAALDGKQGMEVAWEWRPDLVLLDVILPGLQGTEVCQLLKDHPKTRHIPILMLTSLDRPEDVAQGLSTGATDYICKPFNALELRARVATHLRTSRIMGEMVDLEKHISLGRLTAGLCHEVNNPLTVVLGQLELLKSLVKETRQEKCVRMAFESARRIQNLVKAMRDYSEPIFRPKQECAINALVENAISIASLGWAGRPIEIETKLVCELPLVLGDTDKLLQVFINILTNASQVMPNGGKITAETGSLENEGAWVFAQVTDTGKGIPRANLARIFDPFWTTKENWTSPGLGLSVGRRIVEEHRGRIEVESEEGQGATFRVVLPAIGTAVSDTPSIPAPAA